MASFQQRKCPDCGGVRFVEDHAQGDLVCAGCGLVVEAHLIDEHSEWRTFSDKDGAGADPNRVGGPTDPLLEGGGLTTVIAKKQGDGSTTLNRLHLRNNNPNKALQFAFRKVDDLAEKLNLTNESIKCAAHELYKKGMESGKLRGRSTLAICAACIYLACRQNNTPRPFKEITGIMPPEVSKKDISAVFKLLLNLMKDATKDKDEQLHERLAPVAQHPAAYMKRFGNELKLETALVRALEAMAYAAKPKQESAQSQLRGWDSSQPMTVAATILYILTTIKDPIPMHQIVNVVNVAEVTIKTTYRLMYPHLKELLPDGYNSDEQIARLPRPINKA